MLRNTLFSTLSMCGFAAVSFSLQNTAVAQSQVSDTAASTPEALLAELRDIHPPEPPSIWPPAPGWWLAALIFTLLVIYLCYRYLTKNPETHAYHPDKGHWQQSAILEHQRLNEMLESDAPANQVVSEASVLMRRVALARLPREQAATVQHEEWLQVLDELSSSKQYSDGIGRLLLDHPYRKSSEISKHDIADLLSLMKKTISQPDVVVSDV